MTIEIGDIFETESDKSWYKKFMVISSRHRFREYRVMCIEKGPDYGAVGVAETDFAASYFSNPRVHKIGNKNSLSRLECIIWGINEF